VQEAAGFLEDRAQHRLGELAGERVLLARVIGGNQGGALGESDFGAVGKAWLRFEARPSGHLPSLEKGVKGDPSQGDYNADAREKRELGFQVALAACHLARGGFVGRRRAADRGGDPRVTEGEAVSPMSGRRLRGEAGFVERASEPLAAPVSGEHPARAVPSMGCGGKTDD